MMGWWCAVSQGRFCSQMGTTYQPARITLLAMSGNNEAVNTTPQAPAPTLPDSERLAYSVEESARLLGVHYFSVYRMIQRGKLRACRVLRGKLLVPRSELLKLLKSE
jgi:excisionase family DNA binding protein